MGFKKTVKGDDATEIGTDIQPPSATDAAAADAVAASQTPAPAPAIPDPITATDDAGTMRPLSGGSFIRQADGTLTRNQEA